MILRDTWLAKMLADRLKHEATPFLPNKNKPVLSLPPRSKPVPDKHIYLTDHVLAKFAPRSVNFADGLNQCADRYQINTPKRLAAFLGQLWVESGAFRHVKESLNYSVDGLLRTFSRSRISESECRRYGRTGAQDANQQMIANTVYGGEWGSKNLGNTQPGDGWRFIGRSLVHVTGRRNYNLASIALFGDTRLWDRPEMLERPDAAALAAGWFWSARGLNALADEWEIGKITKIVNGGQSHLAERIERSERALSLISA